MLGMSELFSGQCFQVVDNPQACLNAQLSFWAGSKVQFAG